MDAIFFSKTAYNTASSNEPTSKVAAAVDCNAFETWRSPDARRRQREGVPNADGDRFPGAFRGSSVGRRAKSNSRIPSRALERPVQTSANLAPVSSGQSLIGRVKERSSISGIYQLRCTPISHRVLLIKANFKHRTIEREVQRYVDANSPRCAFRIF